MKKFLVGCLVIVVLGGALLAVGGFLLYRAASPMIDSARSYLEGMSKLAELNKNIKNQTEFAAPANGELTEAQVARFVRVQESVRTALGQRLSEIEAKYKTLKSDPATTEPSLTEMLSALRDLGSVFLDARRYQVDALNKETFSQSEYSWVRDRVYRAAGVEVASAVDFQKLADAARKGTGIEDIKVPESPLPEVPQRNRELVKPFMNRMDEWLPLAFFGL